MSSPSVWSACRCCGLVQTLPQPAAGYTRMCARCKTPFGSGMVRPQIALACALTVLFLFMIAQFYPTMSVEIEGQSHAATISTDVVQLSDHAFASLGLLVFGLAVAAPFLRITALIWILRCLRLHRRPAYLTKLFRVSELLRPWAMLDVLLLGIIVSSSKLRDIAQVDTQIGLWALGLCVLVIFIMETALDRRAMWDVLKAPTHFSTAPDTKAYTSCHVCEWLQKNGESQCCERCGATLHARKPASMQQTWALVIAGLILYIPANTYPVLITTSLGNANPATIMGGVRQLLNGQDWPLAVILFTASIIIPLMKLFSFMWLMISAQLHHRSHLVFRTRVYRFIYFIGRWSNTDIFVGATLTGLVTLGNLANIVPGIGGVAFGAVVLLTMLAAETFDPRLMWDAAEVKHGAA